MYNILIEVIIVLKNKLGITDPAELAREEEKTSKKRASELFEKSLLDTLAVSENACLFYLLFRA